MEQRELGRSGMTASIFGLGTMTFGDEASEEESHAILDRYAGAGGRFIDTADVYTRGVSEEIIGRWLGRQSTQDEFKIATKARFAMSDDPADCGAGSSYLPKALDASLARLNVDIIDLYQIHAWDPKVPAEETVETLNGFVEAGKIRAYGVSNYLGWQLERVARVADEHGWAPVVSLQPQYNLLARDIELELIPLCLDRGIAILPWSPLGGGWLTGKYNRDSHPTGATRLGEDPTRGLEAYDVRNHERTWIILDAVQDVAHDRGVSMGQVALNWLRRRPTVGSVLLGVRNVAQLEDNLAALRWDLTDDELSRLNDVSAPGIPTYPHGFLERYVGVRTWDELRTRVKSPF